jgi:type 1 glutamine amidotransferase
MRRPATARARVRGEIDVAFRAVEEGAFTIARQTFRALRAWGPLVLVSAFVGMTGPACTSRASGAADGASGGIAAGDDAPGSGGSAADAAPGPFRVLLFTRTAAYRHDAIPAAISALMALQTQGGFTADNTEDPTRFTAAGLAPYQVVVFLMTTGDVLDDTQQAAFEAWVRAGGGYVGVHSAADTEYDWPFYGGLVGAYFSDHPAIQQATVGIERADRGGTMGLPAAWVRTDEWYNFRSNPRANVTVLATLDESTYSGGTMGADHPIVWVHDVDAGRAFYTAMGHTAESYADPSFRGHLVGALRSAAHLEP